MSRLWYQVHHHQQNMLGLSHKGKVTKPLIPTIGSRLSHEVSRSMIVRCSFRFFAHFFLKTNGLERGGGLSQRFIPKNCRIWAKF